MLARAVMDLIPGESASDVDLDIAINKIHSISQFEKLYDMNDSFPFQ